MKYMLDTNICIYLLKHQPPSVVAKFASLAVGDVVISSISWAELLRGCDVYEPKSAFDRLRSLIPVVPFDEKHHKPLPKFCKTIHTSLSLIR